MNARPELAYALYHALVAAGHAPWCPALDRADGPCHCGRTAALRTYEAERGPGKRPVLSLVVDEDLG